MSWVAVAIGGSALIGAGTAIYASKKSSEASEEAASAQTQAQREAMNTEWEMFQQMRGDYAPWRAAGERALGTLEQMMRTGPGEFVPKEQPGYQFGFKNFIEQPYLSSQSAKGKRLSGETVKGLTKFAGDYAETAYDNFLNRYYQRLRPFQTMAGIGQTALGQETAAGGQFTNAISGMQQNIGTIQGQNFMNQGNIASGTGAAIGGIAQGSGQNFMNYMMWSKMMDKLGAK